MVCPHAGLVHGLVVRVYFVFKLSRLENAIIRVESLGLYPATSGFKFHLTFGNDGIRRAEGNLVIDKDPTAGMIDEESASTELRRILLLSLSIEY